MEQVINIIYVVIAAIFVLFSPGFFISLIFFDFGKIDLIERVALSFALSISIIPLVTFYANLIGLKINVGLVIIEVVIICTLCAWIYYFRNYKKR